jgi:hypothetical protein
MKVLKKGQNVNEHTPQDRIRKMSSGIVSLSCIKHDIHFHNDRFYYLGSSPI